MSLKGYLWDWQFMDIARSDLVLEVGSGNRPFARSNVLCDLGEYGEEARYGGNVTADTVTDRPFVFSDAYRLPFRDGAFDYLISSHMLEHLEDPAAFLSEACRVARSGCIITPSESFELLIAERTHLWYITQENDCLLLRAKQPEDKGPFGDLFQQLWPESHELRHLLLTRNDIFEIRYPYSNGCIDFHIDGEPMQVAPEPEPEPEVEMYTLFSRKVMAKIRSVLGFGVRKLFSDVRPDLNDLLACPACGEDAFLGNNKVCCSGCGRAYPMQNDSPVMIAAHADMSCA